MDQAQNQKDIVFYRRSSADEAQESRDAPDGHAIASDDPDGIRIQSFGGQNSSNVQHIAQLQTWFNMMAANPQGVGGITLGADSATEANILQQNASTGLEDIKDLVYVFSQEEQEKRAWYMHHDPLIEVPVPYRRLQPEQTVEGPLGPVTIQSARDETIQIILTPDLRRGDWLGFTFIVEPESMGRVTSVERLRRAERFAVQIIPAAAQAAQIMRQMGVPFDVKEYIIRMGKELDIRWLDRVLNDPLFQQQVAQMAQLGPQDPGKALGQPPSLQKQILQNGQPATNSATFPSIYREKKMDEQRGANESQSAMRT